MKVCVLLALLLAVRGWDASEAATTQPPPSPPVNTDNNANGNDSASNTLPPPPSPPSPGTGTGGDRGQQQPPLPPPPVWVQCLSGAPQGGSLPDLFQFWCSNYSQIIPCIASGLTTERARNPLDQFVQLHFDSEQMTARSQQLCPNFLSLGSRSQCTQQNNASVEGWCHARFSQGQQYVFAVRAQRAFDNDINVYRDLACQVVNDTTGCLGSAMTGCDVETKRHLLAFYAFFTNESCQADPSAEYATPAPPPPPEAAPRDVVITCAQRIAETLSPNPPSQNASQLEQLLYGLQQNCKTFEARYNCYDQELNKITNPSFRDIWLSFTFDSANAIQSQKQFCLAFEGGIADALTPACYNRSQPLLQQCEEQYGRGVVSIQGQWLENQLDNAGLHKAACRTSMQRAFCLRNAFRQCGEVLAEAMLNSELHTLPNICLSLLPGNNDNNTDTDTTTTTNNDNHFRESAAESEPVGHLEGDSAPHPTPPVPGAEHNREGEDEGGEEKEPSSSSSSGGQDQDATVGAATEEDDDDSMASGLRGNSALVIIFAGVVSLGFVIVV